MQFYNTQNLNRLTQINYSIRALKYLKEGFFIDVILGCVLNVHLISPSLMILITFIQESIAKCRMFCRKVFLELSCLVGW